LKSISPLKFRSKAPLRIAELLGVVLSLGSLLYAGPAQAQRAFYLDRVQIGGAPDDGLVTRRPYLSPETRLYGSTTLGYVVNPLRASTVAADSEVEEKIENLIQQQVISYFTGGIQIAQRAAVSLTLPVAWVQSGGDVPIQGFRPPAPSIFPIDTGTALYDVALEGRALVHDDPERELRVGLGAALFIPSGTFSRGGSDNRVSFYLYGAAEKSFGPLLLVGSLGPHFRPLRGIDGGDSRLDVGSEVRINAGAFIDLHDRIRVGGELNGMVGIDENEAGESTFFDAASTPFEWLGSGRLLLGADSRTYARASLGTRFTNGYGAPDLRVMVSLGRWVLLDDLMPEDTTHVRLSGDRRTLEKPMPDKDSDADGFPDAIDACPQEAEDGQEPYPADGCPASSDRDGDGVIDLQDKCPDDPEDNDGIQDADGCPEKDADGDGVLDVRDACPLVPGMEQGDPKRDGCASKAPRKLVVEAEKGELRLLEPVEFETGTAELKEASHSLLNEVLGVMLDAPDIRLAVHGHTDSRGAPAYNRDLSQRRAQAVVKYLTDKGIAFERLEARGFGPDKPIGSNDSDEGRARNRRVEFKILQGAESGPKAKPGAAD
jgi:outer membrane protein OmpA-like peptidoglycan-associated protein